MAIDLNINSDIYFSEEFKVIVRSCKELLLSRASEMALVDKSFMYAHRNNFHTFLRGLGIDDRVIWPTAFINDILVPSDNFMDKASIYVVDVNDLDRLITQLRTIKINS